MQTIVYKNFEVKSPYAKSSCSMFPCKTWNFWGHVRTVPGKTYVKFEVRSFSLIRLKVKKKSTKGPVAALAIDKAGPRPCYFRPGPTSGPATWPGSQKSKISTEKNSVCLIT